MKIKRNTLLNEELNPLLTILTFLSFMNTFLDPTDRRCLSKQVFPCKKQPCDVNIMIDFLPKMLG